MVYGKDMKTLEVTVGNSRKNLIDHVNTTIHIVTAIKFVEGDKKCIVKYLESALHTMLE